MTYDLTSFRLIELLFGNALVSFNELLRLRAVSRGCGAAVERVCRLALLPAWQRVLDGDAAVSGVLALALVRRKQVRALVRLEPVDVASAFHPFAHAAPSVRNAFVLARAALSDADALAATICSAAPTRVRVPESRGAVSVIELRLDDELSVSATQLASLAARAGAGALVGVALVLGRRAWLLDAVCDVTILVLGVLHRLASDAALLQYAPQSSREVARAVVRPLLGAIAFVYVSTLSQRLAAGDASWWLPASVTATSWAGAAAFRAFLLWRSVGMAVPAVARLASQGAAARDDARNRFTVTRSMPRQLDVRQSAVPRQLRRYAQAAVAALGVAAAVAIAMLSVALV